MTETQGNILNFIRNYFAQHGFPPSQGTIACQFGVSKPTIHEHLQHLLRQGLVKVTGEAGRHRRYAPVENCPTCGGPFKR